MVGWLKQRKRHSGPDVLLIVPTFGNFDYAKKCIDSLEQHPGSHRYTIDYCLIDDASSDIGTFDLSTLARQPLMVNYFPERAGLSRSWNRGLRFARQVGAKYAVCGNSDLLFSHGWLDPLIEALHQGFSLVGPLSNAPGHAKWQNVRRFLPIDKGALIDDSEASRQEVSHTLSLASIAASEAPLNGFALAAAVKTWWRGSFDAENVFNPAFPLKHNEVELQSRWRCLGLKSAVVPKSYVFHYRSVSRPEGLVGEIAYGAMRALPRL